MRSRNEPTITKRRKSCLCSHLLSKFSHYNRLLRWGLNYLLNMCHRAFTSVGVHTLEYPRVCSHKRDVEFDSQHTHSNATSGRRIVGSYWFSDWLWVDSGFGCGWLAHSLSILPLKLTWLVMERPRFVVNYRNLLAPRAFVKMSTVCRFVLMYCKSISLARTHSRMKC